MAAGPSPRNFRMGLVQLAVGFNKADNVKRALNFVKAAKGHGCKVVALPECFNSPYGIEHFADYAEHIPCGETSRAMSKAAKEHGIYLIAGSIPERSMGEIFNTCTVWGPLGNLLATHRKMHLFDVNVPGGISFKESEKMSPGNLFTTFSTIYCKIGIGICYDLRFEEMASIYRSQGCELLVYPGAFSMHTGPLHWEVLLRARAIDNQLYVAGVAPARVDRATYMSYGHSLVANPWGTMITKADYGEELIYTDIDLGIVDEMRSQIPKFSQRRTDVYNTTLTE